MIMQSIWYESSENTKRDEDMKKAPAINGSRKEDLRRLKIIISKPWKMRNKCKTYIYREFPRNKRVILGFGKS